MTRLAQLERSGLCDDALAVGLDAPTRCEGWTVRDLLVHLVIRDGRPDVAASLGAGRVVPALGRRGARVRDRLAALPARQLADLVRTGPPRLSPARWAPLDQLVNLAEYHVHREDVRRAQPGWEPRELPAQESQALWRTATLMGRLAYRGASTGVVLVTPDGPRAVVRRGASAVSLTGQPQELLLHAFGRRDVARVQVGGAPEAVALFRHSHP